MVGADARLFELRPVAGIDGNSLMGRRVGSCAFSPITLVDSAIPIISVLEELEELDDETRAELEVMFGIGGRDGK